MRQMLDLLWSVGGYLLAVAVLVSFHEFGHFWVARRLGVKVLRYAMGFGRPLWKRVGRDGTEYVIAALPLGGYVRMLDEREGPVAASELSRAFNRQHLLTRVAIVAAGPIFNFVLAVAAYWAVFVIGMPDLKPFIAAPAEQSVAARMGLQSGDRIVSADGHPIVTWSALRTLLISHALDRSPMSVAVLRGHEAPRELQMDFSSVRVDPEFLFDDLGLHAYQPPLPAVLSEVLPNSPAAQAGFVVGDRLLSNDGQAISSWQQWAAFVHAHPGHVTRVSVLRGGVAHDVNVLLGSQGQGDHRIGRFGAGVEDQPQLWHDLQSEYRLDPLAAVPAALTQTWRMSSLTGVLLWRVVTGDISPRNLGGPIRTAEAAGVAVRLGLVSFLSFLAFVSINLGLVNLLPVPVLDGGHLLYYLVEAVRGTPLSERAQAFGQQVGLTLLALLIGFVFYNDIVSQLG